MHELSITQSMFEIVLQHAEKAQAKKVTKINLVIGEMTGVVAESIQFYLDFLSKGTVAEGVVAVIKMIPPTVKCSSCGRTFAVNQLEWKCPRCGGINLEIIGGKELLVESIEVV